MASEVKGSRESGRIRDINQKRKLDVFARAKRQKRHLDNLEKDNFHEDPHANLQLIRKKFPQFNSNEGGSARKKKKTRGDHFKQRFRKNFNMLLEEEQSRSSQEDGPNYFTAAAPPSEFPPRKFCSVCGFPSHYTCISCGSKYCSVRCLGTHQDTRCLKWVG